jgi:crossover junction endodeoxyribonuclease RuvC
LNSDRIILGIDPGTNIMGYGLIHIKMKKPEIILLDVLNLSKIEDHNLKLKKIFESTIELIQQYKPDDMAIEAPFFGKNVQSMLKLGRAQGVAIAAAMSCNIPITEYSPKKIKQSITGNGNASKEQVALMLKSLLKLGELPQYLDATDGLAAAVCHYFQGNSVKGEEKFSSWKSFVSSNEKRIIKK